MKTKKSLLVILTIVIITFTIFTSFIAFDIKKNFVKIDDKLYACRYEVSNSEYREFLKDLKATNQNDKYLKCMYDSTQWTKKWPLSFNEPMTKYYHWHPAYDNYPIVGITLDAAKAYCEWLTDKYSKSTKKSFKKVLFRLPTVSEWEDLANPLPGHNLPWYGNFPYTDADGKIALTNIKVKNIHRHNDYVSDGGLYTLSVGHYKPNTLGIYDVIGNAAEMTKYDTIKGGSWANYLNECTIDTIQNFTLPDPRVGFRVVMEVIEEK